MSLSKEFVAIQYLQYIDWRSIKTVICIPQKAFAYNVFLREFRSNVTIIEDEAFKNCTALTKFKSQELNAIGKHAFSGCWSLKGCINLGNQIKNVPDGAFKNCHQLELVICSANIIENEAFMLCLKLLLKINTFNYIDFRKNSCIGMKSCICHDNISKENRPSQIYLHLLYMPSLPKNALVFFPDNKFGQTSQTGDILLY